MMARESAKLAALSVPVKPEPASEKNVSGHWAQMKAMIQMAPRRSLIDETTFDEAAVERAAKEMEVNLTTSGSKAGGAGLASLKESRESIFVSSPMAKMASR